MKLYCLLLLALLQSGSVTSGPDSTAAVSFERLRWERLPDLNTPRTGHQVLYVGDEISVFGGHSDGFVPVGTMEYYRGGAWHEIPMTWPHDAGFALPLRDGKVMLGGGCAEAFGIGQTWGVEIYDSENHKSTSLGILDRKRTMASAFALSDGRVIVSGNWYADDAVEVFQPQEKFVFLKETSEQRTQPYILQTGPEQILIFGGVGSRNEALRGRVDRLEGESFHVPLLEEWCCLSPACPGSQMAVADYICLLAAQNRDDGRYALLKVEGEDFSLLETEPSVPMAGPNGESIQWGGLLVDRASRQAYLPGYDGEGVFYLARIDCGPVLEGGKALVRLFYAENPDGAFPFGSLALLPGGKIVMTGGGMKRSADGTVQPDNFSTFKTVYLFSTERGKERSWPLWPAIVAVLLPAGAAIFYARWRTARRKTEKPAVPQVPDKEEVVSDDLMSRIVRLMEEQQLYRKKNLRKADVAKKLGTNLTYVSATVNSQTGASFTEFVTGYRIRHAQRLMREQPRMLLSEVSELSGFASEQSFFRAFKARTGQTPTEWKSSGQ